MIENILVPKHELMKPEEAEEVLKKYAATREELPKIKADDAAIADFETNPGDIIKITRNNPLIGEVLYYRVVVG